MSIDSNKNTIPGEAPYRELFRQIFNVVLYLSIVFFIYLIFTTKYEIPLPSTIRVAAPGIERIFPTVSPWGPGFEQDLLREYGKMTGSKIKIKSYPTHEAAFNAIKKGRADIFLGAGYTPRLNGLSIFIKPCRVYEKSPATLLHHTLRYELRTPYELCDQTISSPKNSNLINIFKEYTHKLSCQATLVVGSKASNFKNLLKYNDDKNMRFHLVETGNFVQLQPFLDKLMPTETFGKDLTYRWYCRTDVPGLSASLNKFWGKISSNGTLNEKRELYFGFLPEDTDFYELYLIREDIRQKLPLYTKYILKAAKKYKLDPMFAAAVMYQESRFDPLARSKTGVRGLMQLTNSTAGLLGVSSRLDPEQSTMGGIIYLKKLWKWIGRRNVKGWNRWFLTLAAYNQGLGHVHDAMDVARFMKKPPKSWRSLKQVFPLLTRRKYHTKTRYGYTRGYEAVDYVDSVRYYYYIFKGLAVIPGPEKKYLAPLTAGVPAGWP
ncbi:transglycosylase SLT domain-containing protein [Maridesulfovibrio bastinii]|uniref:transglycosylase SLT domain-containing protein n=1 Tax=Maridesulfovibrio bastinii TaxID=47157 RepID=UPI00041BFD9B|nr:transglycosylase SLT domain-containing protein [Maridesulfovibrio bastinii]